MGLGIGYEDHSVRTKSPSRRSISREKRSKSNKERSRKIPSEHVEKTTVKSNNNTDDKHVKSLSGCQCDTQNSFNNNNTTTTNNKNNNNNSINNNNNNKNSNINNNTNNNNNNNNFNNTTNNNEVVDGSMGGDIGMCTPPPSTSDTGIEGLITNG